MRVADAVVNILKTEGVKFVSTLPGDDILPLFDALHQSAQVPLILIRHEQATVDMAGGYPRAGSSRACGAGDRSQAVGAEAVEMKNEVMECWSNGVLEYWVGRIFPSLHHSFTPIKLGN